MRIKSIKKNVVGLLLVLLLLLPAVSAYADLGYWYTGIFVDTLPNKLIYEVGEKLDLTGLKLGLSIEYENGTKAVKFQDSKGVTFSPGVLTSPGKQVVTLSITAIGEGKQARTFKTTFEVTVNEEGDPPSGWTESISITTKPKKLEYRVDDKFDASGMVVTANQINAGEKEKVKLSNSALNFSPTKFTKSGKQKVTVTANLNDKEGKTKSFTDTVTVMVYDKISISKSPGGEEVQEGGECKFTARAKNYTSLEWFFEKDNKKVSAKDAEKTFNGLKLTGIDSEKIALSNIPIEMDNWSIYCVFESPVETKTTKSCKLRVSERLATPSAEASAVPTETPVPANPTDPPETQPTDDPNAVQTMHVHSFSGQFQSDANEHWLVCACGERSNVAPHAVTEWVVTKPATAKENGVEAGVCIVCGQPVERTVLYTGGLGGNSNTALWVLGGIGALAGVSVPPLLIASFVMRSKEKKRNARRRQAVKASKPEEKPRKKPEEPEWAEPEQEFDDPIKFE